MDNTDASMAALSEAVEVAGGQAALARRLNIPGQSGKGVVWAWFARKRVPAEHCPAIERETGVRCERLRPDVAWEVLREQAAPAAEVSNG